MKLSVIVPVYNVENYLNKCITSIVEQTYKALEIILVDDGSTDTSGQLCDEWKKKDTRVKVIHKSNGGLSSARNAGILQAKGEYISFIDSVVFIVLDMYATMVEALDRTGKDIASCGRVVDLWGEREKKEFLLDRERIFDQKEAVEEVLLLRHIDVSACDKIYKRKLFDNIMYPEGKISEDAAIIFEILTASNGVVHVGKAFYHYIYRKNSISKSQYTHKYYDAYVNCKNTCDYIIQHYPNLDKKCKIYCAQVCGSLLQSMGLNRAIEKKYRSDYIEYKKMFDEGFWQLLMTKDISRKLKIKMLFVYLNLYNVFLKLKKII